MKKIAAIDIGSNGIRLSVAHFDGSKLTVTKKVRVPLRLGAEAFGVGTFSAQTIKEAVKVFEDFSYVIEHEHVESFKAVATSAFRDTANAEELATAVRRRSGVLIEAITGELETTLVRLAINTKMDLRGKSALMMDIGGGSMELSVLHKGELKGAKSFDVGTVRILKSGPELLKKCQVDIEKFLEQYANTLNLNCMIGTGGNFRAMLKLKKQVAKLAKVDYVTPSELKDLHTIMKFTPYLKRIKKYDMRPDRADVILPAMELVLLVCKKVELKKIYAPNVGLIHGVLVDLCGNPVTKIKDMSN